MNDPITNKITSREDEHIGKGTSFNAWFEFRASESQIYVPAEIANHC